MERGNRTGVGGVAGRGGIARERGELQGGVAGGGIGGDRRWKGGENIPAADADSGKVCGGTGEEETEQGYPLSWTPTIAPKPSCPFHHSPTVCLIFNHSLASSSKLREEFEEAFMGCKNSSSISSSSSAAAVFEFQPQLFSSQPPYQTLLISPASLTPWIGALLLRIP
ncbi:hypothetical protein DM860_016584 [Cuscuta australis]|uniref:Uncharacterized protein n=1 Tax=Cuscuta australis TaxID=267555 RepID=A0A328DNW5_9ASTE|nr:hypothetical protein DM860_016584 [Cuscuta australis]